MSELKDPLSDQKLFDHSGKEIEDVDHVLENLLQTDGRLEEIEKILKSGNKDEIETVTNISIPNAEKDLAAIEESVPENLKDKYQEASDKLRKLKESL